MTTIKAVVVTMIVVCCGQFANAAPRSLTPTEQSGVIKAISVDLRDPFSAHFKWSKTIYPTRGMQPYCGMVNAKNLYGAYVGFTTFFVFLIYHQKTNEFVGAAEPNYVGTPGDRSERHALKLCKKFGFDLSEAE